MIEKLPLIVAVSIKQKALNIDNIVTEIYCVNETDQIFNISARGSSFTTIDEETGEALQHGSPVVSLVLEPAKSARIGDVQGWELDSAESIDITFQNPIDKETILMRFYMQDWDTDYKIKGINKTGKILKGYALEEVTSENKSPSDAIQIPENCKLWLFQTFTREGLSASFEAVKEYEDDSHLMRKLMKCRECGQLYFYEFYEIVDWEGGNDAQYGSWIPIKDEQSGDLLNTFSPERLLGLLAIHADFPTDAEVPGRPFWANRK